MFETDVEYLRNEEKIYKKLGLRIIDKNILLKNKHKHFKLLFFIIVIVSIIYAFIIGLAIGGE